MKITIRSLGLIGLLGGLGGAINACRNTEWNRGLALVVDQLEAVVLQSYPWRDLGFASWFWRMEVSAIYRLDDRL